MNSRAHAKIVSSTFIGNVAAENGAAFLEPSHAWSRPTIADTLFCENEPNHVGGDYDDLGGNTFLDSCDPIAGDLNDDGVVDVSDLLILLAAWSTCADPGDCPADLTGDGAVDISDLLMLLGNWG